MELVPQNATVKVCFASLEKTEEMEDQTLQIFAWKKVEKTEIWRAWTVALYNSLWEQRILQRVCFQSSVPICRLETLLLPPYKVHHQARTTQPKPAHLNPVSTPAQDEWCIKESFFCWNFCLLIYEETGNSCSGSLMPFCRFFSRITTVPPLPQSPLHLLCAVSINDMYVLGSVPVFEGSKNIA